MTGVRLSTTSYVVLGTIARRGPSTPYELKRAVEHSVGWFWPFPHAQLYAEPERLAGLGLLALTVEDTGRRRKTYSITGPGVDALRDWLAAPTDEDVQIRDVAALKLVLHDTGEREDLRIPAAEQIHRHRARIAVLDGLLERSPGADSAIALEWGLEMEHAALRFWTALADDDLRRLRAARALPE